MTFDPKSDSADVAVIGAGGAGLLAGISAARAGAKTVLYERMKTAAKKVAISGGGRCNFTNTLDARRFVQLFGDKHSARLGTSLRAFSNRDVIAMLAQYGVEGQLEKNYRLYTKSGRGNDVVNALVSEFQKAGGVLVTQARVSSIQRDAATGHYMLAGKFGDDEEHRHARTIVVCTGGLSYPVTGSTGDGYAWARGIGHQVTALRPALVGLTVEESWTKLLQGLAWEDAACSLWAMPPPGSSVPPGKALCVERAEILFTHFGISGPAILDVSNTFVQCGLPRALLTIDFFPNITREQMDQQILDRAKQFPSRTPPNALEGMMPTRLMEHLERILGPDATVAMCRLPKTARAKILDMLKRTALTVKGTRGMEYGEVTAGGIDWEKLDATTLESLLSPGLFFAGEILDLTGRCGGFNLQAAFSTGFLAGKKAAQRAKDERATTAAQGHRDTTN